MKIGIYGGSFNPVHFGHIGLAKWVTAHTDLDELWLMVSPNNPLKPADSLAPESERLAAVKEAVKGIAHVIASDFEFTLPRPSYTANTLRALQTAFPEHEFTLVIGEDNLAIFPQWREYEYILENYRIFVYPRNPNNPNNLSIPKTDKGVIYLSGAPLYNISSTAIRHSHGRP